MKSLVPTPSLLYTTLVPEAGARDHTQRPAVDTGLDDGANAGPVGILMQIMTGASAPGMLNLV